MKSKTIRKFTIFYLCLVFFIIALGNIFITKNTSGPFSDSIRIKGFYNELRGSIDAVFVGSSHSYTSVNPILYEKLSGLSSYNFASASQPIEASYYYINEAIRYHKPSTIFLESYMFNLREEYNEVSIRAAIDEMPLSYNKLSFINQLVPVNERSYYYFPMLKYHTRWNELQISDFDMSYKNKTHLLKGHVALEGKPIDNFLKEKYAYNDELKLSEKDLKYFFKILDLVRDNDVELVLFLAPYALSDDEYTKQFLIGELAQDNNLTFINLNNSLDIFNFDNDFYDSGHLSRTGAEKFTSELYSRYSILIP